ncbi:MAG: 50S ribosomal protein L5 [Candidatus Pacebacteria bacterium]|jgi:large subunit ribosomal protein L5|nr:50S ribosomal protein L5 [Candidatus Paceibacterota bacterium]
MLKENYKKKVIPEMKKDFGYKNDLSIPRIEKVIINTGIGKILSNIDPSNRNKVIENIVSEMSLIAGQKPILTESKKAVAGFKTREGSPVGLKVTLRGERMIDFLDRLFNIVIPRMRDFRGIKEKSIDEGGNLTIGIKEHIIFPEIAPEKAKNIFGLEVTIVINAKKRKEAVNLFKLLEIPLAPGEKNKFID